MFPKAMMVVVQDMGHPSQDLGVPHSPGDTPNSQGDTPNSPGGSLNPRPGDTPSSSPALEVLPSLTEDRHLPTSKLCTVDQDLEEPSQRSVVPQATPSPGGSGHLLQLSQHTGHLRLNHKAIPAHLLMEETLGPVSPLDKAMEHPHSRPARATTTRQHRATAKDNHPRHQVLPTPTKQERSPL